MTLFEMNLFLAICRVDLCIFYFTNFLCIFFKNSCQIYFHNRSIIVTQLTSARCYIFTDFIRYVHTRTYARICNTHILHARTHTHPHTHTHTHWKNSQTNYKQGSLPCKQYEHVIQPPSQLKKNNIQKKNKNKQQQLCINKKQTLEVTLI